VQMISPISWALLRSLIPFTPAEFSSQMPLPPQWVSTLLGVFFFPAWLVPFRKFEQSLYWTIPLSTLILLIPYCYASYRSELWMADKLLRRQGGSVPELARLLLRANVCSYAAIGVGVLLWLGWSLTHPPSG
jgi:hypothetical protein